jgi:hypothetical protein
MNGWLVRMLELVEGELFRELGVAVTFTDLNFLSIQKKSDEQGKLQDPCLRTEGKGFSR